MNSRLKHLACLTLCLPSLAFAATELRIAVAANFLDTLNVLSDVYTKSTKQTVLLSSGSTGKLYAQLINGAPFDLFFSADTERPALLERAGIGVSESRFDYAIGRLVLWSPAVNAIAAQAPYFSPDEIGFIAIANPKLAPYGRAARQTLEFLGVWEQLQQKLVRGENINQVYHYVRSGTADIGMVALAQLIRTDQLDEGSHWLIPQEIYTPIVQAAVVISDRPDSHRFAAFMQSQSATEIIEQHGYGIPR